MGDHTTTPAAADRLGNNFSALRLLFALLVLYSHSYPLATGREGDLLNRAVTPKLSFSYLAVDGFFLISGCLITQSFLRSRSASDFVIRRVLRIYPGYWVALLFSLAVGVAVAEPGPVPYLKELFYANDLAVKGVLFLDYGWLDQPQVFPNNPHPKAVNGSLWTLQPELQCYALTLALGAFGLAGRRSAVLVLLALVGAVYAANVFAHTGVSHKFIRLGGFFLLGALASGFDPRVFRLTPLRLAASVAVAVAAARVETVLLMVYPVVLAYWVFGVAYARWTPGAARLADHDLSYGIYLYAFPVQQLSVRYLGLSTATDLFLVALPFTLVLAYLSWVFVERPCLAVAARLTRRPPRAAPPLVANGPPVSLPGAVSGPLPTAPTRPEAV